MLLPVDDWSLALLLIDESFALLFMDEPLGVELAL
jgi:hypothetical protein